MDAAELFERLGGVMVDGFPAIPSPVFHTKKGTPYLKRPGVAMLMRPSVHIGGLRSFLEGFHKELEFLGYLEDPTELSPGVQLVKTSGQTCYMSFGPKRTYNRDAQRYIENLLSQRHGSVLEHPSWSFLGYGISRSLTHEQVRHRAGWAYSQVSQRYVSGRVLRFVERPEYQGDPHLHRSFERRIDRTAKEYGKLVAYLAEKQRKGDPSLEAVSKTDLRKRVQQCARSLLPNETEAPIILTANARAWRHVAEMRANFHAETEIREFIFRAFLCLVVSEPMLFADYTIEELPDGTYTVSTPYSKV